MDLPRDTPGDRWLPVAYAAALFAGVALIAWDGGRLVPPCLFRETTGLLCPGCGSGRMVAALLRFDLGTAVRSNALALAAAVPAGYGLLREGLSAWGIAELPWPATARRATRAVIVVIAVFWVLRNVPLWPFTLLTPA